MTWESQLFLQLVCTMYLYLCLSTLDQINLAHLSSANPTRHLTSVKFEDAPGGGSGGGEEGEEEGGGGGGGVADKKISAEELFESVCSLKAAQTQMQLQDGEELTRKCT